MLKTYRGSCHCGQVSFTCDIDLSEGIRKCNCSFCRKTRMQKVFVYKQRFHLLTRADALCDYQGEPSTWPAGDVHHYFCKRCGVRAFSKGHLDFEPFNGEFHVVNAACLDDAAAEEIAAAPVIFEDGLNDRQDRAPDMTAQL
ncbi:MAG: GFA family protein [Nitratireductor sp.]